MSSPPSEVSFRPSRSYGLLTAREAHDWFLQMMREHEEFEVETDVVGPTAPNAAGTLGALSRGQEERGAAPEGTAPLSRCHSYLVPREPARS